MLLNVLRIAIGLGLATLAALAAGSMLGLPLFEPALGFEPPFWRVAKASIPYLPFAAALGLAAIAIGEDRRLRHWAYWLFAGILIAIAGFFVLRGQGASAAMTGGRAPLNFVLMGGAGGLVYWLLAGRKAGALVAAGSLFTGSGVTGAEASTGRDEQRRCAVCAVLWLLIGLLPLGLLGWYTIHRSAPPLSERITAKAEADAVNLLAAAGLPALQLKVDGHTGHITGTVADGATKTKYFETAKTALAPLIGVPGVVAVLQNDLLAIDDSDPRVAAENARIKAAEIEAARKHAEEARLAAEVAAKRKADEELARQTAEEARLAAEVAAKRKADEELARQKAEEARLAAEVEAKRKADEELARQKAEEARLAAEVAAKRKADEELARQKAEEARLAAEVDAKRKADEDSARAHAAAASLAAEAAAIRNAEDEASRKQRAETARRAEEAQVKVQNQAEVDAKRKADEDSARAHAAAARLAAEAAAIRNAEDETARQRAEAARLAAQGPIKTEDQVKPATDASPPVPAASGQVSGSTSSPGSERAPELEANLASCMKEFSEIPMAQSIRFRSNSSELSGRHSELLDSIAAVAKRCDAMSLVIGGHTDWSGNELSNQSLSDERAEAVRAALVERGVVSKRLETMSFGARQPADGVYRGRAVAADRRVEVKAREYIAVPAAP